MIEAFGTLFQFAISANDYPHGNLINDLKPSPDRVNDDFVLTLSDSGTPMPCV